MLNILVESIGLVDAAYHRVTKKGESKLHAKLAKDQTDGKYHNFITTEYSIITAHRFIIDYIEKHDLKRSEERRLLDEFRDVLEPYFSDDSQYIIHRVNELDIMLQIGSVFQSLDEDADIEEAVISFLAKGPYDGAHVICCESAAYQQQNIPMYYAFSDH